MYWWLFRVLDTLEYSKVVMELSVTIAKLKNSISSKVLGSNGNVVLMHFSSPASITIKYQSISLQVDLVQKKRKITFDVGEVFENIHIVKDEDSRAESDLIEIFDTVYSLDPFDLGIKADLRRRALDVKPDIDDNGVIVSPCQLLLNRLILVHFWQLK